MPAEFEAIFAALRPVLTRYSKRLAVKADTPGEYTLVGKSASPHPQHKGQPLWFGSIRLGKAYVSFHLMPLYMNPALTKSIPATLKKRMQGKTCFNFKAIPDADQIAGLEQLTESGYQQWHGKEWI